MKHLKWYINLHVEFMRETNNEERDFSQPYFKSKTYTLLSKDAMTDNTLNEPLLFLYDQIGLQRYLHLDYYNGRISYD
jgi:hypothetical protein